MNRLLLREGLHPLYVPYYDALRRVLSDEWQPVQGRRSFEDQADLYAQGRTLPGPIVTRAAAGMSFHNYGLATDWGYFPGGKYVNIAYEDPLWNEYIQACTQVGVECIRWERPHNQMKLPYPVNWLYNAYQTGGWAAVETTLKEGKRYVGSNS